MRSTVYSWRHLVKVTAGLDSGRYCILAAMPRMKSLRPAIAERLDNSDVHDGT